jgi:hypothetical protein
MTRRTIWFLLGALALVSVVLLVLLRDDGMPSAGAASPASPHSAAVASPDAASPDRGTTSEAAAAVVVQTPVIIDPETDKPLIEPLPLQQGELPWEGRIRVVLTREKLTDAEKARALLDLLPSIAAEGAQTCAEEAVKRLPNSDYRFAQAAITNPGTYGLAEAVLFSDLMERPDDLRLPTLLTIARNSAHPYASPALDNLELLLGKNCGSDWARWDAAVREKLAGR